MKYPTILVHVEAGARAAERTALACALAKRQQAHLIGAAATGLARALLPGLPSEQDDSTLQLHLSFLREPATAALAAFSAHCTALGAASFEAQLLDDEAGPGLSLLARVADLVLMAQGELAGQLIVHSARPVLLLPEAVATPTLGQRIVVAWDGGREAARAMQAALPLLQAAAQVSVLVVGEAAVADPRAWLARHGVTATLEQRPRQGRKPDVGTLLLARAAELQADLLVMGGYGHSRLHEAILGGVTRTVLESMRLPVLMAH